jgi:hypothetical protein
LSQINVEKENRVTRLKLMTSRGEERGEKSNSLKMIGGQVQKVRILAICVGLSFRFPRPPPPPFEFVENKTMGDPMFSPLLP